MKSSHETRKMGRGQMRVALLLTRLGERIASAGSQPLRYGPYHLHSDGWYRLHPECLEQPNARNQGLAPQGERHD